MSVLFFRLCYVKLKLLLIAIEYKSEQRESRFVLFCLKIHHAQYTDQRGAKQLCPSLVLQTPYSTVLLFNLLEIVFFIIKSLCK